MRIQDSLQTILNSVDGLESIMIIDSYCSIVTTIGKSNKTQLGAIQGYKAICDQVKKFQIGNLKSLSLIYENKTLVFLRFNLLTVIMIADIKVSGQYLVELRDKFNPIIEECLQASTILKEI
uniref:Roadblock/LC7 domain-containing protein n=1 Tax=Parastrongyloides trichosuri TaxID=131310 RepID=A0A0N4ZL94_PARTI